MQNTPGNPLRRGELCDGLKTTTGKRPKQGDQYFKLKEIGDMDLICHRTLNHLRRPVVWLPKSQTYLAFAKSLHNFGDDIILNANIMFIKLYAYHMLRHIWQYHVRGHSAFSPVNMFKLFKFSMDSPVRINLFEQ